MYRLQNSSPIGVFDSGVGGLSVVQSISNQLPDEPLVYIADQANVPYGNRDYEEVQELSEKITRFLFRLEVKTIVVACNTASAAALYHLRELYPWMPFVGMEPAVKPAAELTQSGKVGVLATPATFQGKLYASVVERFANNVNVFQQTCPGLVEKIERGLVADVSTRSLLEEALNPLLAQNIDTLVLGCTHFPFVIPIIEEIVGAGVKVIDPSPAIARQTKRILESRELLIPRERSGSSTRPAIFYTTGDLDHFEQVSRKLLSEKIKTGKLIWEKDGSIRLEDLEGPQPGFPGLVQ